MPESRRACRQARITNHESQSPILRVSVISWNTKELLKECLKSVGAQKTNFNFQTQVIDNGSTDGSLEMIGSDFTEVEIIKNDINQGFAKAANIAIKSCDDKYHLILNSDTALKPGSIQSLIDFMEKEPSSGAVGPLLLNPNNSVQLSGRKFPSFKEAAVHAFIGTFVPNNRLSKSYRMADWDRNDTAEVDWVSGAAIALRAKAVKDIGLFDEGYFMYVEDMDLCYRLWKSNWKVFLLPEAKVMHHMGQSSKKQSVRMIKEFQKSIYRFYVKQNHDSYKRYFKYFVACGLFVRAILLILTNWLKRKG